MLAIGERHQQRVGSESIDVNEEIGDGAEPTSVLAVDFPPTHVARRFDQAQRRELGKRTNSH